MSGTSPVSITSQDHLQGNSEAAIELIEYGDFQCSHCAIAYPVVKAVQREFGEKICFVFRHFPLTDSHMYAMAAAIASEAASLQGKFWEMHDIIFENQNMLSEEGLLKMADRIGLDVEQYKKDFHREDLRQRINADVESGDQNGVHGTPTFFVNGSKFTGSTQELLGFLIVKASGD